jgi:hypothetical protein
MVHLSQAIGKCHLEVPQACIMGMTSTWFF